jgi:DNA-binding MarR family transcriptional regulator
MTSLENDIEILENAVRSFVQTMKRPQRWSAVTARAKVDIDRPSAFILQTLLNKQRGCHVQELALQLGIEPPSVTRKTQELEQAGYLERVADPEDRRAVDLRITARGKAVAKRLWKAQHDMIAEVLQGWDVSERRQFVRLFKRFSDNLMAASIKQTVKQGDSNV